MKIVTTFLAAITIATLGSARPDNTVFHADTARDATIAYNGFSDANGNPDAYTPKGNDDTLISFKGNRDYRRILLGYNLPSNIKDPSLITKCTLNVPKPVLPVDQDYTLTVYTASSNWEEDTVDAGTKIISDKIVGSGGFSAGKYSGTISITGACQAAAEGKFSMFVDTNQPLVVFNSQNSGKDTFSVDITY
ncbi:hypothetical protein COEREDRAFT_89676 [Coemansia reversa NRRL 1564]|uniref:Ubiquitin 3 binding protein But2 C-terminal domain-containing protein n=1 Tax=Coemansia reversa (strain ATCC 12441 / NRRL 1564) TaxID=763665 RepID=A0A2G5B2U9_COERN|nr:hypothetical protein COEREDRAFT_89676 [Coemansia reversa NRRL 1564]|eukprot:PIA13325.1 hypothetical protein COEREDRAFT_89676 [Coemansia reversa NRRL 1564]